MSQRRKDMDWFKSRNPNAAAIVADVFAQGAAYGRSDAVMTPADRARMERATQVIETLTKERDEARRVARVLAKLAIRETDPEAREHEDSDMRTALAYPEVKS